MKKEEIISVLSEWNFWGKGLETGKKRAYSNIILNNLEGKVNKIITVFGVRRAGKSYILRQVCKALSEKYGKENVLYVNLEEASFEEKSNKLLDDIYSSFLEIIRPKIKPFVLLDEIQEVKEWEKWVRSMHERDACRFVVSGSSAKLMSGELATLLSGRDISLEVFPLNFSEFLEFRGIRIKDKKDMVVRKRDIIVSLREILEFGGFPEVVESENDTKKREILRRYFETILIKDVQKRYKIREIESLEFLGNYYISNISSLVSFNKLSRFLKIPIKTVERFSKYLESSRMIFFIPKYSFSLKERKVSSRKVYSIDLGISNACGFKLMKNYGQLIENCVAINLISKLRRPMYEIYYWRDYQQHEVDFLIKEGLEVKQLIQVTYASGRDEIDKREIRSLLKAADLFAQDKPELMMITWDYEAEEEIKGKKIRFIPLWKWLLDWE